MTTRRPGRSLSRRTAVAGLGVGGLATALTSARSTSAQDTIDLASHPMVGTWAAKTPDGIVPQIHGADGSVIAAFAPNYVDPQLGLTFQGPGLGRWEPDGERSALITFVQMLSDEGGAFVGTFQVSSRIEVSEDGQTWIGGGDGVRIIARDAANTVLVDQQVSPDESPVVTATRIGATVESVVLPVATPAEATPTG